jgi:probable rRNA maturation factor
MPPAVPLTIYHQYTSMPFPAARLQQLAKNIYTKEKVSLSSSTVLVLCSDYRIKKLNSDYRDVHRPTDVLSFCFGDPDLLGEIYISLQRAAVQARRYGLPYDDEIVRLFVHGMFHLLGYDHIEESQRTIMEAKERKYFKV